MTHAAAIDVHAHYLPPAYRRALAQAGITRPDGFPRVPEWSTESALSLMDEAGIAAAVMSVSSPGLHFVSLEARIELARLVNDEGAAAAIESDGRLGVFASLPLPDVDASLLEIAYACDVLDVDGFVLMTNYDGVYLGDPRLDPIFEELDRRNAVVALHPTSPPAADAVDLGRPSPMIEFVFDTTRAVANLILSETLSRSPHITVIVPHLGSALPSVADRIQVFVTEILQVDPAKVDVPTALDGLYYDLAGAALPHALAGLLTIARPSRILYGTDAPFSPPPLVASAAEGLRLTPQFSAEDRRSVFGLNAIELFPRFESLRTA